MPLEVPQLDVRTFDQLVDEARRRIPIYTPEWTDFNDSDPGMTLVQLFAWLTEMTLFQLNRVPARNHIKLLQLLGLELRPAQPATAHLTFTTVPGSSPVSLPPRTRVAAQPSDGRDLVIFETTSGLDLVRWPLTDILVYDGASFSAATLANSTPGTTFRPLGWVPRIGSALYLGFEPADPPVADRPFPQEVRFRIFGPDAAPGGQAQNADEVRLPPAAPVQLVWEYKPSEAATRWRRMTVLDDESVAFTRDGYIRLAGPSDIEVVRGEAGVAAPRYWLRCRLVSGTYPANRAPEIDLIRPNTVSAESLTTVRDEVVGIGDGFPEQQFQLRRRPVARESLSLWTEEEGGAVQWYRRDDFLASKRDSRHFRLDATTGTISFGDGARGQIPTAGVEIVAREYRSGGGAAGNVGRGEIVTPLAPPTGVDTVTNERPAVGGRDEQSLQSLEEDAPGVLRSRGRAVTADDFAALARQAGGVARATAISQAHPDHPGVNVPGAVTVVIVPESESMPPRPSPDLMRSVASYLNQYRLLTTELYVAGPVYHEIRVEAKVAAQPYASFGIVERDVNAAINAYLSPLGPNQTGWGFGQDLYPTSIFGVIQRVKDVAQVLRLSVTVNGAPHDDNTKPIVMRPDGLVFGVADHVIDVGLLRDQ